MKTLKIILIGCLLAGAAGAAVYVYKKKKSSRNLGNEDPTELQPGLGPLTRESKAKAPKNHIDSAITIRLQGILRDQAQQTNNPFARQKVV